MVIMVILCDFPTLHYFHELTFAAQQFQCLQSKVALWQQQLFAVAIGGISLCSY